MWPKVGVSAEFGHDLPPDTKKPFFQKSLKNRVPPPWILALESVGWCLLEITCFYGPITRNCNSVVLGICIPSDGTAEEALRQDSGSSPARPREPSPRQRTQSAACAHYITLQSGPASNAAGESPKTQNHNLRVKSPASNAAGETPKTQNHNPRVKCLNRKSFMELS